MGSERFVLYYQSQGTRPRVQSPEVLCVGTLKRCEAAKRELLANSLFRLVQLRDGGGGVLRIVPQARGAAVVAREVPFSRGVYPLGPVTPV
jgi:hypothetical protein